MYTPHSLGILPWRSSISEMKHDTNDIICFCFSNIFKHPFILACFKIRHTKKNKIFLSIWVVKLDIFKQGPCSPLAPPGTIKLQHDLFMALAGQVESEILLILLMEKRNPTHQLGVSKNSGTMWYPQIIHLFIGLEPWFSPSILGGKIPLFLETHQLRFGGLSYDVFEGFQHHPNGGYCRSQ